MAVTCVVHLYLRHMLSRAVDMIARFKFKNRSDLVKNGINTDFMISASVAQYKRKLCLCDSLGGYKGSTGSDFSNLPFKNVPESFRIVPNYSSNNVLARTVVMQNRA